MMGEARRKPARSRTRRKAGDTRSDAELMAALVDAALPLIPFDGVSDKVLRAAAAAAEIDLVTLERLFPNGPLSLAEALSLAADREMETRLAALDLAHMKVRARITTAIRTRLDILRPHKEAARRTAAFLTLPPHAAMGAKLLYRTVDAIWRAAGDTATDFNFYTKRGLLAAVYSATLVRWFNDESDGEVDTDTFLARRIENVMGFEKLKAKLRERVRHLPSLADILRGPAPRRR